MKNEESAYAFFIEIVLKNTTISENEKQRKLAIIISFMQKMSGISIETLKTFNEASEINPELAEKLKQIIRQGERSQYPVQK